MTEPVPARFFHGTRRGFTRGGVLFPRAAHGGDATSAPVNPGRAPLSDADQWVYVTGDIDVAWAYAFAAPGRGKPKVLVVEPRGRLEPDPEHSVHMNAWRTEWAAVVDVLTTPTMSEDEARSGWQTNAP